MSRRSGQHGYIENSGDWYVVRWRMDVEGQDEYGENLPDLRSRQVVRIIAYLKRNAAYRDVDFHPDVAEFLQRYFGEKCGLLFATRNGTPHLHNNIEDRWLTERLKAMGLDELGMGLRGKRCQEDINIFWMGHKPKTMSEIYSHLFEEIDMRLAEAEAVGFGFDLPKNPSDKPLLHRLHRDLKLKFSKK